MHLNKNKKKGYTLLLAILVILIIGTTFSLFAFTLVDNSSRSALALNQSKNAIDLANLCSELGIKKIKDTPYFTGQESYSSSEGHCNYTITSVVDGGTITWDIQANGDSAGAIRKNQLALEAVIPPEPDPPVPVLTSWREVANFD